MIYIVPKLKPIILDKATAKTIVTNVNRVDFQWLVGYLEGEGCFFNTVSRHSVCPIIQVAATDWDVVFRAASIMGVSTDRVGIEKRKAPWKDCWKFYVGGALAVEWMTRLLPYMGLRRGKTIQTILSFYENGRLYDTGSNGGGRANLLVEMTTGDHDSS